MAEPGIEESKVKKVAIVTFHNAVNYGAILQCYALQSYLEQQLDCVAEVLDYQPLYFRKVFFDPLRPWKADGLQNKIKALAKCVLLHSEMKKLSRKHRALLQFSQSKLHLCSMETTMKNPHDVYISGSDQVWNLELLLNDTTYLLDFVRSGKKISYAASFKISDVDDFARKAYKENLPTFDSISVRESNLQAYLQDELGLQADSVLDPTLLIGSEFWKAELGGNPLVSERYLLLYHVNMPQKLIDSAFSYAEKHNLTVVSLNTLRGRNDYIDYSQASIEEFLNLVANAQTVFTTSFHGMAFAILFEREFYYEVPEHSYNNNARLEDLAGKLGLQTQNLSKTTYEEISWAAVRTCLEEQRRISAAFLIQALSETERG